MATASESLWHSLKLNSAIGMPQGFWPWPSSSSTICIFGCLYTNILMIWRYLRQMWKIQCQTCNAQLTDWLRGLKTTG